MANPYRKVSSGESVEFNADQWNSFIDAARAERARKHSTTSRESASFKQGSIIRVLNESGSNLSRYSVSGLVQPIFLPSENLDSFQSEVMFRIGAPSSTSPGKFCILIDPLGIGNIARAMVAGVCQVKVNIVNTSHIWAECATGITANLVSGATGSAEMIWKESGTGVKWAVVRIGNKCSA